MRYYVNKNAQSGSRDHEVHNEECDVLPSEENRLALGDFTGCDDAVTEARRHYDDVNGCAFCSPECHTT